MENNKKKRSIVKIVLLAACAVLLVSFNIYMNTGARWANRFQRYLVKLIYSQGTICFPTFLGVRSMQYPSDNWVAQEIIYEIKPDVILEIGTAEGGTALFYATVLEKVNEQGKVITVAIESPDEYRNKLERSLSDEVKRQLHTAKAYEYKIWKEKVTFIKGNSEDPRIVDKITKMIEGRKAFILLDSAKSKAHVLKNLVHYASPVAVGSYIMVHDTAVEPQLYEAVQQFVKANDDFQIDHSRERFLVTWSPSGFLKKVKAKN